MPWILTRTLVQVLTSGKTAPARLATAPSAPSAAPVDRGWRASRPSRSGGPPVQPVPILCPCRVVPPKSIELPDVTVKGKVFKCLKASQANLRSRNGIRENVPASFLPCVSSAYLTPSSPCTLVACAACIGTAAGTLRAQGHWRRRRQHSRDAPRPGCDRSAA